MRLLVVDNYDSFVFNITGRLRRVTGAEGEVEIDVVRNDCIPFSRLEGYSGVILSPGPGLPEEANDMMRLIGEVWQTHPLLGICLGMQGICEYFGGRLRQLPLPRHGHTSPLLEIDSSDPLVGEFRSRGTQVGRYHSWVVERESLPDELMVTSVDEEGNVMSVCHHTFPVYGLQFHPESINTPEGERMLANFLKVVRNRSRERKR